MEKRGMFVCLPQRKIQIVVVWCHEFTIAPMVCAPLGGLLSNVARGCGPRFFLRSSSSTPPSITATEFFQNRRQRQRFDKSAHHFTQLHPVRFGKRTTWVSSVRGEVPRSFWSWRSTRPSVSRRCHVPSTRLKYRPLSGERESSPDFSNN
jgi:hypothetical protein